MQWLSLIIFLACSAIGLAALSIPMLWLSALVSGWLKLAKAFPDTEDRGRWLGAQRPRATTMRGFTMGFPVIAIEAWEHGLRLAMPQMLGLLPPPIFAPWRSIEIHRERSWFFMARAVLDFQSGASRVPLNVEAAIADHLWHAAGSLWPETGTPFPQAISIRHVRGKLIRQWFVLTGLASAFFIVAPRIAMRSTRPAAGATVFPPIAVAILFPALTIGSFFLLSYFLDRRIAKGPRS